MEDPSTSVQIGGLNAVQQVTFPSQPASGNWTLSLPLGSGVTATTATLAPGAPASAVQTAVNAMLANITTGAYAGGSVSVTTVGNAWTYQVTFGGKLQAIEVPTMTFTGAGGISSTASVVTTVEGGQGLNEILPMLCLGKFGDGNLILGGPDAYTGNTYLWDGDLTIRNSTSLGLGSANVYIMGGDNTKIMGSVVASPQYAQLLVDGSLGPVNVTNRGLSSKQRHRLRESRPHHLHAGNPADYNDMIYNIAGNNSWTNYEAAEQQVIDLHTSSTMTGTIAIISLRQQ